ncbi:6-phosphogluconolactonase [Athalassotoga saccharophila]|uniref:6-phosphogluconolactonase n=1 Tax=Athalassotoga saccharophila TaxID=1441386 RepID=UPI001379FE4D|nr:6-phosphogluconolactonase [Athalassotoga saccharophila]BBJ28407.1 6-phosphogluconolactonase [Athalassotoga saccharophila]
MVQRTVNRFKSIEDMNEAILNFLSQYFKKDQIFTLCLAGGNTPKKLYERMALENFPWERIHLFWGDERYVPYDDPRSNYGMAYDSLIKFIKIPPQNVHKIRTDLPLEDAVKDYEETLRSFFDDGPTFDILFLGMGKDGHTASIFPNSPLIHEEKRWVVFTEAGLEPFVERITLTFPVLNRSKNTFILAGGREKIRTLENLSNEMPVNMVRSDHLEIMIYEE